MFVIGDVIECYSSTAGKRKFYLCIREPMDDRAGVFLFINSGSGYDGDFLMADSELPFLPASPTGNSIISLSQPARLTVTHLRLFGGYRKGQLPAAIAVRLAAFAPTVTTLTRDEKTILMAVLATLT